MCVPLTQEAPAARDAAGVFGIRERHLVEIGTVIDTRHTARCTAATAGHDGHVSRREPLHRGVQRVGTIEEQISEVAREGAGGQYGSVVHAADVGALAVRAQLTLTASIHKRVQKKKNARRPA